MATEIELRNLGEKTGVKIIADDNGKVVIATPENQPLQPSNPGGTVDDTAIHSDQASEFSAMTEKAAPVSADLVAIEDSEDGFTKKKVQVGNMGGGGGSTAFDIPHNAAADGNPLKVIIQGIHISADVTGAESFNIHAGSFIRAFEHGSATPLESPPLVAISRDFGATWSGWSSNVWVPYVTFTADVDAGTQIVYIAATDGVYFSVAEVFIVIEDNGSFPSGPTYP